MAEIGIMIEEQEDLTWERFLYLAETAETFGVEHFILQHNDLNDLTTLELPANEALPHFS